MKDLSTDGIKQRFVAKPAKIKPVYPPIIWAEQGGVALTNNPDTPSPPRPHTRVNNGPFVFTLSPCNVPDVFTPDTPDHTTHPWQPPPPTPITSIGKIAPFLNNFFKPQSQKNKMGFMWRARRQWMLTSRMVQGPSWIDRVLTKTDQTPLTALSSH